MIKLGPLFNNCQNCCTLSTALFPVLNFALYTLLSTCASLSICTIQWYLISAAIFIFTYCNLNFCTYLQQYNDNKCDSDSHTKNPGCHQPAAKTKKEKKNPSDPTTDCCLLPYTDSSTGVESFAGL